MSEEASEVVSRGQAEPSTATAVRTFVIVALMLMAVVGGAWLMASDSVDQASVNTSSETSSTGAGSGDSGRAAVPADKPQEPSAQP